MEGGCSLHEDGAEWSRRPSNQAESIRELEKEMRCDLRAEDQAKANGIRLIVREDEPRGPQLLARGKRRGAKQREKSLTLERVGARQSLA